MKRIILLLMLFMPLLSGCTSIDANLSIYNNKSANMEVKIISNKDISPAEVATISSTVKDFPDKSYKIVDNSAANYTNILATKTVKNLTETDMDLSSLGFATKLESGRYIEIKHNFFVTSYNIHMIYNLKNQKGKIKYITNIANTQTSGLKPEYLKFAETSEIIADETSSDFADNFDKNLLTLNNTPENESSTEENTGSNNTQSNAFNLNNVNATFSISLPYYASYNNADSIKGSVYTWNISTSGPTEIKLQYVVYSSFAIWFLFIAGVLLLIYLAFRIHKHDLLKRIGNNN